MIITRYIEQLIEDINRSETFAGERVDRFVNFNDLDSEFVCDDDIDSLGIKLSELFQIDKMFFPERKLLNAEQISLLINAMESLWRAYGLNPVFPPTATDEVKYCQFRDHLDHEVIPVSGKIMDVELCDYLPHHCPFFEWCPLAKEQNECTSKYIVSQ